MCDITDDGELVLTTGAGISPTIARLADHIILELNHAHPKGLRGFHDLYEPLDPPYRREIPVYKPSDRIGATTLKVDPAKILCVVETDVPDETGGFSPLDAVTEQIGANVAHFLAEELKAGRIPKEFLPIQSGVGNIANAVLGSLGENPDIPPFEMFTEVIQDAVIGLMRHGRVKFASGCSLTVSHEVLEQVYADLDFFRDKVVLRPQEISNNPELVRRMGLITINTALEADIFGNVNSTHVLGQKMMNGLGGSGDFTRNAYISIFTTPSTAKGRCHQFHCTDGVARGPLRTFGEGHRHRTWHCRPARQVAHPAGASHHRELRGTRIQGRATRIPHADQRGAHAARLEKLLRHAPPVQGNRQHDGCEVGKIRIENNSDAKGANGHLPFAPFLCHFLGR